MSDEQDEHLHTQRDGETLKMLGAFQMILAVPVIIGTIWADTAFHGVVCFVSGALLLAIGLGFWMKGVSTLKRLD